MSLPESLPEKEKIQLVKTAFEKFRLRITELLKKQFDLFRSIMERIDKRNLEKARKGLNNLNNDKNQ